MFLRVILQNLLMVVGAMHLFGAVSAQSDYPNRQIDFIISFPPGGPTDLAPRLALPHLAPILKVPLVPVNRPGAGGGVAADYVAKSKPDGYTVLATSNPALSVRTAIEKGLTYGLNDFIAIGMYAADVGVFAARKGTGYGSLEALVEFARKNPRQLSYASAGTGSVSHFTAELFKLSYGVDIVHVPYSGSGPAKNAIMGGHVPLVSAAYSAFVPLFSSGDLIPLVTTSPKRLSALPDTPTMAEKGFPNATLNIWMGFFVPAGTPPAIVDTLAKALARIAPDPALIAALDKAGLVPDYRDSDATRKQLQLEFDTVSKATEKIKFD